MQNEPTPTPPDIESFSESVTMAGTAPRVDPEAGIIYGCKLLGAKSRNPGAKAVAYPKATRDKAMPLAEGAVINADHHESGQRVPLRDRIGFVRNVESRDDGLYGDAHLNPRHALAPQILWQAQNASSTLGFSILASGIVNRKDPANPVVTAIESISSIDLVANPASTAGLFESTDAIPSEQREFVEHGLAAVGHMEHILAGSGSQRSKRARLLTVLRGLTAFVGSSAATPVAESATARVPAAPAKTPIRERYRRTQPAAGRAPIAERYRG